MAVQIRLTERQQKLAAGELDTEDLDNTGSLRDAGFDFVDDDSDDGSAGGSSDPGSKVPAGSRKDIASTGIEPSGEYIDDGDPGDGNEVDSELDAGGDSSGDGNEPSGTLPDWVDDRVREYAKSYGMSDDDLADFGSLAQLQRVGSILDRKLTGGSGKAQQVQGAGTGEQVTGGEKADSKGTESGTKQGSGYLDRLKPLDRKRYEDAKYGEAELDLVDQLNATVETIREFMPAIQQQIERQRADQQQAEELEFHQVLDELDPEIYGKAIDGGKMKGRLNPAFSETRNTVRATMDKLREAIIYDAQQRGVQVDIPSTRALAIRAAMLVEEDNGLASKQQSQQSGKDPKQQIAEQSRKRRPVGSGGVRRGTVSGSGKSGGNNSAGSGDEIKQILNSPAINQFWKQTQRENGVT